MGKYTVLRDCVFRGKRWVAGGEVDFDKDVDVPHHFELVPKKEKTKKEKPKKEKPKRAGKGKVTKVEGPAA